MKRQHNGVGFVQSALFADFVKLYRSSQVNSIDPGIFTSFLDAERASLD